MKGKYKVLIQNKKVKYEFEIRRNLTVIQGNSATGKTTLVDMIREYDENGAASGITLYCERECVVLEGRRWKADLREIAESLVFIDEGNGFVMSEEFAAEIQKTDNYYIIVAREALPMLPYSVEEIYGIRNAGKYGGLKQTYNEFYHIYRSGMSVNKEIIPEYVIVEDSNSGFDFFQAVCQESKITCVSSNGKSGMINVIPEQNDQIVLLIADGAAFGSEMEKIAQDTYLRYQKRKLNPAYLQEQLRNKIVGTIEGICFGKDYSWIVH